MPSSKQDMYTMTVRSGLKNELAGVREWIRLLSKPSRRYPTKWRRGMLRHYKKRVLELEKKLNGLR